MKRMIASALVLGTWLVAGLEGRAQSPANQFTGGQGGTLRMLPRTTNPGLGFGNSLAPSFTTPGLSPYNNPNFGNPLVNNTIANNPAFNPAPAFNNPFPTNNPFNFNNPFNGFNGFNPYANPFANPYLNPQANLMANPFVSPYANPYAANPFVGAANPFVNLY